MRVNPTWENPLAFDHGSPATILPAIDPTAKGELVARRRFQRGSVYQNRAKTVWLGMYSQYVLDSNGVERRKRKSVVLGPIRKANGEEMRKREAQRLLQPYLDRVNSSISAPVREHKSATFEAFVAIWERLSVSVEAFHASDHAGAG